MIHEVEIQNFKCIKNLKIKGFSNVNFFVGSANSGKTTVLEALYLLFGKDDNLKRLIRRMLTNRGIVCNTRLEYDDFASLFYDQNTEEHIEICSKDRKLKIPSFYDDITNIDKLDNENDAEFIFHDFRLKLLNQTIEEVMHNKDTKDKFKRLFQAFDDESIEDFFIGSYGLEIHHKHLTNSVNIRQMGQGFGFVLTIFALIARGDRVIIIDELENGLHYTAMDLVLKTIFKFASDKANPVQFFISTHSLEVLQKANLLLDGGKFGEDLARVFNVFVRQSGEIDYINYSQESFIKELDRDNEIRSF